jgi:hypothetical protein
MYIGKHSNVLISVMSVSIPMWEKLQYINPINVCICPRCYTIKIFAKTILNRNLKFLRRRYFWNRNICPRSYLANEMQSIIAKLSRNNDRRNLGTSNSPALKNLTFRWVLAKLQTKFDNLWSAQKWHEQCRYVCLHCF